MFYAEGQPLALPHDPRKRRHHDGADRGGGG